MSRLEHSAPLHQWNTGPEPVSRTPVWIRTLQTPSTLTNPELSWTGHTLWDSAPHVSTPTMTTSIPWLTSAQLKGGENPHWRGNNDPQLSADMELIAEVRRGDAHSVVSAEETTPSHHIKGRDYQQPAAMRPRRLDEAGAAHGAGRPRKDNSNRATWVSAAERETTAAVYHEKIHRRRRQTFHFIEKWEDKSIKLHKMGQYLTERVQRTCSFCSSLKSAVKCLQRAAEKSWEDQIWQPAALL